MDQLVFHLSKFQNADAAPLIGYPAGHAPIRTLIEEDRLNVRFPFIDLQFGDESSASLYAGYRTLLPLDIGLELKFENVDYKDKVFFNKDWTRGEEEYNNWSVGLQRDMLGVTWGLSYIDTDLSKAECLNFMGYDDVCSATLMASASKTF